MSGGVDSSTTAYLLKEQGYLCEGATMRLYDQRTAGRDSARACGNEQDIADAAQLCQRLGIPHHVLDYRDIFDEQVIEPFCRAYEEGLTPNPCAICNRRVKFGAMLSWALSHGFDAIATGHYANVACDPDGVYRLTRGVDPKKDQSYFLYSLTQEQLAHVILPLGPLTKEDEVRAIAAGQGFTCASKRDSQGICFVPDNDFATFIENRRGTHLPHGPIRYTDGQVVGEHTGAIRYTIGQRKGLGVALAHPVFVTSIDTRTNTVTLGEADDLLVGALTTREWVWSAPAERMQSALASAGGAGIPVAAKIRYHQQDQAARMLLEADGKTVRFEFEKPQRAVAPGQAVVAYHGDTVLGGGEIAATFKP